MPVSRNRKKKSIKQQNKCKSKPTNDRMIDALLGLDNCKRCDGLRDEFSFEELSDEQQTHWIKSGVVDQIDYFLYCPNCEEYSAIFEIDKV